MKNRFKAIRESKNLTLQEVGKKIGRSASYLKGVEDGTRPFNEVVYLGLCGMYKVTGDEVFGFELKGINKEKCDVVFLDCCIMFLIGAAQKQKAELSKKKLASFVELLHEAVCACDLNFTQTRSMARVIVAKLA